MDWFHLLDEMVAQGRIEALAANSLRDAVKVALRSRRNCLRCHMPEVSLCPTCVGPMFREKP